MTNEKKMRGVEAIPIKLSWGSSEKAPTLYANNLYITHAGNEFYLVFGELPPILEPDIENLPEYLEIRPVVKIAVSPENMIKFANAIQENVNKFNENFGRMNDDSTNNSSE